MDISVRSFLLAAALFFACFSFFTMTGGAEEARIIRGKVADEKTGQPIANAKITIQSVDVARRMTTITNKKGEYAYLLGNQGEFFRIIVHAQGYQPQYRENVRPEIRETKEDFRLIAGADPICDEADANNPECFQQPGIEKNMTIRKEPEPK